MTNGKRHPLNQENIRVLFLNTVLFEDETKDQELVHLHGTCRHGWKIP